MEQLKSIISDGGVKLTLHVKTFDVLTVSELYALLQVRSDVFVVEQNCVYQDLDDDDQTALHLWLTSDDGRILALARVCAAGTHMKEVSIGRVIATERGKGYGLLIVKAARDAATDILGASIIEIEAQEYTRHFYEKVGFVQISDVFLLDGIPHIKMTYVDVSR